MPIDLDTSHWPLVLFRSRGALTDAEFEAYLGSYDEVLGRAEQQVIVFDARGARSLTSDQARRHAAWMEAHQEAISRQGLGIAFVIPSPMIRGVLKAILWMRPMPQAHVVVDTLGEALDWARARLEAAGLTMPDVSDLT